MGASGHVLRCSVSGGPFLMGYLLPTVETSLINTPLSCLVFTPLPHSCFSGPPPLINPLLISPCLRFCFGGKLRHLSFSVIHFCTLLGSCILHLHFRIWAEILALTLFIQVTDTLRVTTVRWVLSHELLGPER